MEGLREVLDSPEMEALSEYALGGDRIFFGQYNSATPVTGRPSTATEGGRKRVREAREFLREKDDDWESLESKEQLENFRDVPKNEASEMLLRWDMQNCPPDILITNFTMLSIMLVRDVESPIFESTKEWLEEDPKNNIFYLILDELHSYRGTGGTEIAYTIRLFLDRIGLQPDSPQLRIIATSASLEDAEEGDVDPEFLRDFFGLDKQSDTFSIVSGDQLRPTVHEAELVSELSALFEVYASSETLEEKEKTKNELVERLPLSNDPNEIGVIEQALQSVAVSSQYGRSSAGLVSPPFTIGDISRHLFDGSDLAAKGFLSVLVDGWGDGREQYFRGKLRMHIFVKTLVGIRRVMKIQGGELVDAILCNSDVSFDVDHNAIALDVDYCQTCGELFYRGWLNEETDSQYLTADKLLGTNRTSRQAYVNFNKEKFGDDEWERLPFSGMTGRVLDRPPRLNQSESYANFRVLPEGNKLPRCPNCAGVSPGRDPQSPIRTTGTGYQRIIQVLSDEVLSALAAEDKDQKTIVFSDSRRDASRLAAELELNHFKDALRALVEERLSNSTLAAEEFEEVVDKWRNGSVSAMTKYARQINEPDWGDTFVDSDDALKESLIQARRANLSKFRTISIKDLADYCYKEMIDTGINPSGIEISSFDQSERLWQRLLTDRTDATQKRVREILTDECIRILFDSTSRDLESLGLGWLTFNRDEFPDAKSDEIELVDTALRFLCKFYRPGTQNERYRREVPLYFLRDLQDRFGYASTGGAQQQLIDELYDKIRRFKIVGTNLFPKWEELAVHPRGDAFWECSNCRSVQLFPGNGECRVYWRGGRRCEGTLQQRPIAALIKRDNYFVSFREKGVHQRTLRVEEIIGHTETADKTARQRLFQGKVIGDLKRLLPNEGRDRSSKNYLELDVLSVTTTMEAGVDLGSLNAIVLGGMPPRRFNYQQRVGRAGRRKEALSVAVTFCKGQKHDEYYFANREYMVAENTSAPKLDPSNPSIVGRIINKFVLNRLFEEYFSSHPNESDPSSTDVNNGRMGILSNLPLRFPALKEIFEFEEKTLVDRLVNIFAESKPENVQSLVSSVPQVLGKYAEERHQEFSDKYSPDFSLSLLMTLEGDLPLYGMPSRSVSLLTASPFSSQNEGRLPVKYGAISRGEDIAIGEWAPGQQVLKDKKLYTVNGVGWPQKSDGRLSFGFPPESHRSKFEVCENCSTVLSAQETECSNCFDQSKTRTYFGVRPEYYFVDGHTAETYSGHIRSDPQTILRQYIPQSSRETIKVENFSLVSSKGIVKSINCNDMDGFNFAQDFGRDRQGAWIEEGTSTAEGDPWALYSERFTDFLQIRYSDCEGYFEGAGFGSAGSAIKSAWISLGELFRTGMCLLEDIEPNEIQTYAKIQGGEWGLFLADTLDNGAGYCTKYADPEEFLVLCDNLEARVLPDMLLSESHLKNCLTSCHKCLRNYDNRLHHHELSWRLALDLFRLMRGSGNIVDFGDHWNGLLVDYIPKRLSSILVKASLHVSEVEGKHVYVGKFNKGETFTLLPWHPLDGGSSARNLALLDVEDKLGGPVISFCPHQFSIAPLTVTQGIRKEVASYGTR
jgi:Lhr-like helicase